MIRRQLFNLVMAALERTEVGRAVLWHAWLKGFELGGQLAVDEQHALARFQPVTLAELEAAGSPLAALQEAFGKNN